MPSSMAPSMVSKSEYSPSSCPLVRGRPRSLAHRPLPSITMATCLGQRPRPAAPAAGRRTDAVWAGLVAVGRAARRGASRLIMSLRPVGGRPTAASVARARGATAGAPPPGHCTRGAGRPRCGRRCVQSPDGQRDHELDRGRGRPGRAGRPAVGAHRRRRTGPRTRHAGPECRRPRIRTGPGPNPAVAIARSRNASSTNVLACSADGQGPQRPQRQLEQPQRRLELDRGEPLGRLGDRAGRGVAGVVAARAACRTARCSPPAGPCAAPRPWLLGSPAIWMSTCPNGSSLAPNRDVVRRTPFAAARTRPCRRVSIVMMRSDSPELLHAQHDRVVAIDRNPYRHPPIVVPTLSRLARAVRTATVLILKQPGPRVPRCHTSSSVTAGPTAST